MPSGRGGILFIIARHRVVLAEDSSKRYGKVKTHAMAASDKIVNIQIEDGDLAALKNSGYQLCFAKKVEGYAYNVVWQAYGNYLSNNKFSWTSQYELFCSNTFQGNIPVVISTNVVGIGLGQVSTLGKAGSLSNAVAGGNQTGINMQNDYGYIYPGLKQLSTGIDNKTISTPVFVTKTAIVIGGISLIPAEKVLVWFQQDIQTSFMFDEGPAENKPGAWSTPVEIDLTASNTETRLYKNGAWSKPS